MMRAAVFLLGCFPLCVLAVMSAIEMTAAPQEHRLPAEMSADDAGATAAAARKTAADARQFLEWLAACDPLTGSDPPPPVPTEIQPAFEHLPRAWRAWITARTAARDAAELVSSAKSRDVAALEAAFAKIKALAEDKELSQLIGGRPLVEACKTKVAEATVVLRRAEAEKLLADANAALEHDQPEEAARACKRLATEYGDVADAAAVADLAKAADLGVRWREIEAAYNAKDYAEAARKCRQLLSDHRAELERNKQTDAVKRALFRAEAKTLGVEFGEDRQRWRKSLDAFLETYGRAVTSREPWINDGIRAEYDARRAVLEGIKAAESLKVKPASGLAECLQRAAAIEKQHPGDEVRIALRESLLAALKNSLPDKSLREDEGLKEFEHRTAGIIRLTGTFDKTVYQRMPGYAYRRPGSGPAGAAKDFYPEAELVRVPGQSVSRRCVELYAAARATLFASPEKPGSWENFARVCDMLQRDFTEWKAKPWANPQEKSAWLTANPDLSFAREATAAREVLEEKNFAVLVRILGR